MQESRTELAKLKASLAIIQKQAVKEVVDVPRLRTKLLEVEGGLNNLFDRLCEVPLTEDITKELDQIADARDVIEELHARLSQLEFDASTKLETEKLELQREEAILGSLVNWKDGKFPMRKKTGSWNYNGWNSKLAGSSKSNKSWNSKKQRLLPRNV